MKKLILTALTLSFVGVFASSAMATWDTCTILQVGVAGTDENFFKVGVCDGSNDTAAGVNDGKWLTLVQQQDTSMATLLTAFSLGASVKVNADFATASTDGSALGAVETIYLK